MYTPRKLAHAARCCSKTFPQKLNDPKQHLDDLIPHHISVEVAGALGTQELLWNECRYSDPFFSKKTLTKGQCGPLDDLWPHFY